MMRLLLDEGLSFRAAADLRDRGIDAAHVYDLELNATDDARILDVARRDDHVIVTFDADFHALLARSGATGPSVIRIRIELPNHADQAKLIERVLREHQAALTQGVAMTVTEQKIRVRQLPLP